MPNWSHVMLLKDYADAPNEPGIYEIGFWVEPEFFVPRYIGRARGRLDKQQLPGTSIRSRLSAHARGRGNKPIERALASFKNIEDHCLYDPDVLTESGRQIMMAVNKLLHCRHMKTSMAESREASLLHRCGINEFDQYVWNRRREGRPPA